MGLGRGGTNDRHVRGNHRRGVCSWGGEKQEGGRKVE